MFEKDCDQRDFSYFCREGGDRVGDHKNSHLFERRLQTDWYSETLVMLAQLLVSVFSWATMVKTQRPKKPRRKYNGKAQLKEYRRILEGEQTRSLVPRNEMNDND